MMPKQYIIPGMMIRDMLVPVPLDWSNPDGPIIQIFVREIIDPVKRRDDLPTLAFLQGGPGGKSPRPSGGGPAWLSEALKTHRVILIDQRGRDAAAGSRLRPCPASKPERQVQTI
nr:hypothetical protein [Marinicella sp. W31]MDC2878452.1 hypothetical protein [Marinicella sp. W31]